MKNIAIFSILFGSLIAAAEPLTSIGTCTAGGKKKVFIVKQWHLSPGTNTRLDNNVPQQTNQTAIYKGVRDWIDQNKVDAVVSEGCEGIIDDKFKTNFNGWDFQSLANIQKESELEKVVTLVPMKLKVHFGKKLPVYCGDSLAESKKGELALSDLRGWNGFYGRLANPKSEAQFKDYAKTVTGMLKIDPNTAKPELLHKVHERMRKAVDEFRASLNRRNTAFVKAVEASKGTGIAVVIGGMHLEDLKSQLQTAKFSCEVFEPEGYQREDELLMSKLEKMLDQ